MLLLSLMSSTLCTLYHSHKEETVYAPYWKEGPVTKEAPTTFVQLDSSQLWLSVRGSLYGWERLLSSGFGCGFFLPNLSPESLLSAARLKDSLSVRVCVCAVFAFWAPCVEWATSCYWHCQINPFKKDICLLQHVCVWVLHTIFRLWRILHYSC